MKYSQLLTIAALTSGSDACESHVQSELATLMEITQSFENDEINFVNTIKERKEDLERLSNEEP